MIFFKKKKIIFFIKREKGISRQPSLKTPIHLLNGSFIHPVFSAH